MSKKYDQLENFSNASAIQYKYLTRKNEHKKKSSPITKFYLHFINSIQLTRGKWQMSKKYDQLENFSNASAIL
jgi:hypothetical protein